MTDSRSCVSAFIDLLCVRAVRALPYAHVLCTHASGLQQTLCLLLQAVALIAMDIRMHGMLLEVHVDDTLIQMLLPVDSWSGTQRACVCVRVQVLHPAIDTFRQTHQARSGTLTRLHRTGRSRGQPGQPVRCAHHRPVDWSARAHTHTHTNLAGETTKEPDEDDYINATCYAHDSMREFDKITYSPEGLVAHLTRILYRSSHIDDDMNGGTSVV